MTDHRCLAGTGCRGAVSVDDPTTGQTSRQAAVIPQEHGLCDACRSMVEHTVNDLTETWLALHLAIGDTGRRLNQKVTISRAAPINLNTDADALKVAIVEWVSAAATRVAEQLNIAQDDDHPGVEARNSTDAEAARVMIAATRLLAPNISRLLEQPHDDVMVWLTGKETQYAGERLYVDDQGISHVGVTVTAMSGAEIGLKLVELRRKARSLLALTATNDKLSFPCPRCNLYELTRTHRQLNTGDKREIDEIGCGSCNFKRSYEHYQNLCAIWVKEDEMEREKLQKQLDTVRRELETAKSLLAKREYQFGLALDCSEIPASVWAREVLLSSEPDRPEDLMTDKDIANIVGVSDSTIRGWASQGLIERHTQPDGSVRFLAQEVWAYATQKTGKMATKRRLDNYRNARSSDV